MTQLQLSIALSSNPMTAPIHSGKVKAEGIDWSVSAVHPSEMFWRQLKFKEFDISEMSISSLSISACAGLQDWVGLPVFTTRRFFHTGMVVREDSGIEAPADLIGKRVGVPEYQQTAAVWTRGALLHEFGVSPEQMTWTMERTPSKSHGGATSFTPPDGVSLTYMDPGTNMNEMLMTGQLDAAIHYVAANNLVDRSKVRPDTLGGIRTLFRDTAAEEVRYFASSGIFPTNHTVVVRRELLERYPWIALNVYSAFLQAKQLAYEPMRTVLKPWSDIGAVPASVMSAVRDVDPLPYGLVEQAPVLDALTTYLVEQGLTSRKVGLEELFATSTLDL